MCASTRVLCRGGGSAVMQPLMTPSYANGRGTQSHHNHRPSTVAFSFVDIQYTVMVSPSMRQRVVLHSITGLNFPVACESPESVPMSSKAMLSILGPSGAGNISCSNQSCYALFPEQPCTQLKCVIHEIILNLHSWIWPAFGLCSFVHL